MNISATTRAFFVVAALVSSAAAGCAGAKPVKAPTEATAQSAATAGNAQTSTANANNGGADVTTGNLHVSDEIARLCALHAKGAAAPSFDFDSVQIAPDDRDVLADVAKCLVEGALRGRNVMLVGRADSRGEHEYNMALGGTRSHAVQKYLHDLGVQEERLRATSRGELDATGTSEPGWARDRRVDIELIN